MKTITLTPKAPFNFELSVSQIEGWNLSFYYVWTGETYFQSLAMDDFSTAFSLTWNKSIDKPKLALDLPDDLSKKQTDKVVAVIERMFTLNLDLNHVLKTVDDERLVKIIKKKWGFHPVVFPSPWECICFNIITSQISEKLSSRITEKLMTNYSEPISWQNMDFLVFPRPDQLQHAEYQALRELQLSMRKAEYLIDMARDISSKKLDLDGLMNAPNEKIYETLMSIRGVGKFTATFAMVFGYGRMNSRTTIEGSFRRVLAQVYQIENLTDDRYEEILESWNEYREIGLFYVWRTHNGN